MAAGHEYALYAASRSIALPLAIIYAMALRSRAGVAALAVAMTLVQLFDGIVGLRLDDPGRDYGPMVLAPINFWAALVDAQVRCDTSRTVRF